MDTIFQVVKEKLTLTILPKLEDAKQDIQSLFPETNFFLYIGAGGDKTQHLHFSLVLQDNSKINKCLNPAPSLFVQLKQKNSDSEPLLSAFIMWDDGYTESIMFDTTILATNNLDETISKLEEAIPKLIQLLVETFKLKSNRAIILPEEFEESE